MWMWISMPMQSAALINLDASQAKVLDMRESRSRVVPLDDYTAAGSKGKHVCPDGTVVSCFTRSSCSNHRLDALWHDVS